MIYDPETPLGKKVQIVDPATSMVFDAAIMADTEWSYFVSFIRADGGNRVKVARVPWDGPGLRFAPELKLEHRDFDIVDKDTGEVLEEARLARP